MVEYFSGNYHRSMDVDLTNNIIPHKRLREFALCVVADYAKNVNKNINKLVRK